MRAGWIGLGSLGRAMAGRLAESGVELVVWNRTPGKAEGLPAMMAASAAEVVAGCDVIFLCLSDSEAVEAVLRGTGGVLSGGVEGKVVVDTTTNHFVPVALFHELVRQKGGSYLESPVLGSVGPASQGTLTIVTSGQEPAHRRALPYLEKLGKRIFFLRKPGLATRMKLVNNLVLADIMAGLAESVAWGEAIGLDRAQVLDILEAGAGNSAILNGKKAKLLEGDFAPHFSCAMMHKDLHYLQDLARQMRRPLLTAAVTKELFAMAEARGLADQDFSAVYRVFAEQGGEGRA